MDATALEALHAQYGRILHRLAMRLSDGDHGHAEDLVQETLIRAWKHPEALADGRAPLPWLASVLRNLAIDKYRHRRHRPEVTFGTLEWEPATSNDGMDQILDTQVIVAALATLKPDHRAVIMELTTGTVRSPKPPLCSASHRAR